MHSFHQSETTPCILKKTCIEQFPTIKIYYNVNFPDELDAP